MTIDIHQQPWEQPDWYDRHATAPAAAGGPERGRVYRFPDRVIAWERNPLLPIAEALAGAASRHA